MQSSSVGGISLQVELLELQFLEQDCIKIKNTKRTRNRIRIYFKIIRHYFQVLFQVIFELLQQIPLVIL